MKAEWPVIALTTGEPAGIGPELALMLERTEFEARIVLIGDAHLLAERSLALGMAAPRAEIMHVPLARPARAGQLDPGNGRYVLATLDRAIDGCLAGEFDAM